MVGLFLSGALLAQNLVIDPTGSQRTVQTSSYNWSTTATISAGSNTVMLSPCPRGLSANTLVPPQVYAYVSGVGTPEADLITSTTCTQLGGVNGTITFTAANSHGSSTTVGSASEGAQEAINAASYKNISQSESGYTLVPPANYVWQAPVNISSPYMVVDFAGSLVTCEMAARCLMVGSTSKPTYAWDVTVKNFTGRAGCNNCNYPMIEDAAQKTHFFEIHTVNPNPVGSQTSGSSFGSLIQIDNDQAAIIDGLSSYNARWMHCTTTFCSVAVLGKGGRGNSGLLYIKNSNLNMYCAANGVDNQNGNTMRISDSVIQGQAQFAIRSLGSYSNVPNVELDNVYGEVAGCAGSNPLGLGQAGLILSGGFASIKNSVGPVGVAPVFASTGATQYNYYIVAHSSAGSVTSIPLLAGIALTNESGNIPVIWNQFGTTGTITYDVIRTYGQANNPAPYTAICTGGTVASVTCGSVATGLTVGSACSTVGTADICRFTDTASNPTSSYAVSSPSSYWPALGNGSGAGVFWPGSIVVTYANDSGASGPATVRVHLDRMGDNVAYSAVNPVGQLVSTLGDVVPGFFALDCNGVYGGSWVTCLENTQGTTAGATLMLAGGDAVPDLAAAKGRLNFEEGLSGLISGTHKITLVDSNPAKTLNTAGLRPSYDANDCYIGLDNPSQTPAVNAQLAIGCPISISYYIGNAGDNSSYLERLTTSTKILKVPLQLSSTITRYDGLTTGGIGLAPNLGTPFNSGGLTANESAQTVYTTAASGAGSVGNYRVCITLWPTVTGTATAIQGNAIAPSGSGTVTLPVGPALSTATLTNGGGACAALHVAANSAIQCSTTGYSGTGTYQMSCTVEQLQ